MRILQSNKELKNMDVEAARFIGAGLATMALIGAGIGIGIVFGNFLSGALRNPGAAAGQTTNLLLGFALCEATGLFGLVVALIILFG
jgi:F-type H+-transporting ATPase subunit c